MTSGIYAITNTWNGHRYIGSAVNINKRWSVHRHGLRKGTHDNSHLARAWAKYGELAFRFTVLEECGPEELVVAEQSWMDVFLPEYNIARVAGSNLGVHCTEEKRARLSAANMGHEGWMKGKKHSLETRAKISAAGMGHVGWTKGKKMPPEVCAKVSAAKKGRPNGLLGKKRPNQSARMMGHVVSQDALHIRWHVNRGIVNPECKLCKAANP